MTNVPLILPKDLKNKIIKLEAEITILIPSTRGVYEQEKISIDEMEKRVNDVRVYLASRFGGYTSVSGKGGYAQKNGGVVDEEVVKVAAFAEIKQALRFKEELLYKLSFWAQDWDQESVGLEWEGDMFLISRGYNENNDGKKRK